MNWSTTSDSMMVSSESIDSLSEASSSENDTLAEIEQKMVKKKNISSTIDEFMTNNQQAEKEKRNILRNNFTAYEGDDSSVATDSVKESEIPFKLLGK